jgi:hypothetical protein
MANRRSLSYTNVGTTEKQGDQEGPEQLVFGEVIGL